MIRCWRAVPFTLLLPALALSAVLTPGTAERVLLDRHCIGCHNAKTKTAALALDTPTLETAAAEKVLRRLRARNMPPAGLPRPTEAVYNSTAAAFEKSLDAAALAAPNPGRTDTFRRLTRTEYRNSIRDLLSLDVDVANLLPSDESSHGFDNITVDDLSPALLERYLSAARKISHLALGIPGRSPGGDTITLPPDLTQEEHFDKLPLGTRGGTIVPYTFPVEAVYDIQIRLQRDRNEHVEGIAGQHDVDLMLDGEVLKTFTVQAPPAGKDHSQIDRHLQIRVPVKAGPHEISVAFPQRSSALLETERQPYPAHFNMDRHPRLTPAVYAVTINGPYDVKGPGDSPSRQRLLVCRPTAPAQEEPCARRILSTVMRRAYRRPVTPADLSVPLKFFQDNRAEGFENGVEMALRAVLVSPEFLFRVEQDPAGVAPGKAYQISQLELASRLSFFLWSSIPDDELLDAATRGTLRTPAVLEKQVRRMLADQRSRSLVSNFAVQWLYLRNLASATPDMRIFPDFDDNLRQSFRQETELFFESILREDRSVLDLLGADYTFVNERLAKHYGIPHIYGSRFRRIVSEERGGLLRHGSVLTVTSYATRTSPVIRGKWILDNILGIPPPPPPPNVPALKENTGTTQPMSMRERLAQHRENPACRGCHQLMDPVGFALENYDAVGRYRRAENGKALDVSGGLPDGSKFDGVAGLQRALLARPELFATTFTEKLLTYGLGRGVERYDAPAVRRVLRSASAKDYKFSSFIVGVAESLPFQMRRAQGPTP